MSDSPLVLKTGNIFLPPEKGVTDAPPETPSTLPDDAALVHKIPDTGARPPAGVRSPSYDLTAMDTPTMPVRLAGGAWFDKPQPKPSQPGTASSWLTPAVDHDNALKRKPDPLLDQMFKDYPGIDKSIMVVRSPEDHSGRMLESWPPGEPGDSQYPRPRDLPLDKPGIEIIGNRATSTDLAGDVATHYLAKNDPTVKGFYDTFVNSLTPQQQTILRSRYNDAVKFGHEARPFDVWSEMSGVPAYVRDYAFGQREDTRFLYSDEQRQNLDQMVSYLKSQPVEKPSPDPRASALGPQRPSPSGGQDVAGEGAKAAVLGTLQGIGDTPYYIGRGAILTGDILMEQQREISRDWIPTMRLISEIKDPQERYLAMLNMRAAFEDQMPNNLQRNILDQMIQEVTRHPEAIDTYERSANQYLFHTPLYDWFVNGQKTWDKVMDPGDNWRGGMVHNFGRSLGNMLASWATFGLGGQYVGLFGTITQQQASAIDDARKEGIATDQQIINTAILNIIPGAVDALPIEKLLHMGDYSGNLLQELRKMLTEGAIEGTTEGIQQGMQNIIARSVYKSQTDLWDQVVASAGYGAAVGVAAEMFQSLMGVRARYFTPEMIAKLDNHTAPSFEEIMRGRVGPNGEQGPGDVRTGIAAMRSKPPVGKAPPAPARKPKAPPANLPEINLPPGSPGWPFQEGE